MFPGPLVRCDANRAMFNLTPAIVMLCYAAVDELLAQPFFLWGLFFLSAGSASALHGADLDRGKTGAVHGAIITGPISVGPR